MKSIYSSILFCLYGLTCSAVVQTNVIHFSPSDYHSAGQNWSIIEWKEHIYCANHDGLLRYNGNDWDNLSAMEQLDVKVVHVYNERLYVAGENTIGYWSFEPYKSPVYHSLYGKIRNLGVSDVAFWSIAHSDSISNRFRILWALREIVVSALCPKIVIRISILVESVYIRKNCMEIYTILLKIHYRCLIAIRYYIL